MADKLYVRTDDPREKVRIESQERRPDGNIVYVYVEPKDHAGRSESINANMFFTLYFDPEADKKPWPPPRPSSMSSREDWRAYALYMESEVERLKNAKSIFSMSSFPSHHGGLRP